eukprot:Amastigsp_a176394_16.p3 type:complete len:115 gc:universal Amastigsp_a176394_16:128-472(+)
MCARPPDSCTTAGGSCKGPSLGNFESSRGRTTKLGRAHGDEASEGRAARRRRQSHGCEREHRGSMGKKRTVHCWQAARVRIHRLPRRTRGANRMDVCGRLCDCWLVQQDAARLP